MANIKNIVEVLTLGKLKEAIKTLESWQPRGRRPFYFFHWSVPDGQALHGKGIDEIIKAARPNFNPELQKGWMISERYRLLIEPTGSDLPK